MTLRTTDMLFKTQLKWTTTTSTSFGRGLVGQRRNERPRRMGGRARGCGQAGPPNIWAPTANNNDKERALLVIDAGPVDGQNVPNTSCTPPPPCPPLASPSSPNIVIPHSTQDTYGLDVLASPTL
ncbi:hypothetical protein EDD18DRAFT_1107792 [Armillaria luteobubalina]|uniref:Uncharacterized protein n=1 Tax=Armillaria luteobubalina TaxID=153913 RepID=A0AA39Q065_9AGAR|nr:hypothetical protein EDD18DRAFT_1107792 [Armillaria luteobubalina]